MILKNAKLILEDGIPEGNLCVENGRIAWISGAPQEEGIDLNGLYLAPGFVDNHCHGSPAFWHYESPDTAASLSGAALSITASRTGGILRRTEPGRPMIISMILKIYT